jgi:hypothetical protein
MVDIELNTPYATWFEPSISSQLIQLNHPDQSWSEHSSDFHLEVAICGMQKNCKLPVPYENYSLTGGRFGDDAGFTMQSSHKTFLGNR